MNMNFSENVLQRMGRLVLNVKSIKDEYWEGNTQMGSYPEVRITRFGEDDIIIVFEQFNGKNTRHELILSHVEGKVRIFSQMSVIFSHKCAEGRKREEYRAFRHIMVIEGEKNEES